RPTLPASRWRPTSNGRSASPKGETPRQRREPAKPRATDKKPDPRPSEVSKGLPARRFSDRNALVRPLRPPEWRHQIEQDMISPDAVNFQIGLGEALLLEAGPGEQAARGGVLRNAGGLQAVEAERPEGEIAERAN